MGTGSTEDPTPWLRCRCVSTAPGLTVNGEPDPYEDRCLKRPSAEDGLCDHCRQPIGACTDPLCTIPDNCCVESDGRRILVDLKTPCARLWEAPS